MALKPVFTPENSVIAGLATVGLVAATYQLTVGQVSAVHLTPAYEPNTAISIKKAGWTSLAIVAGVSLLARDPNIAILGGAAIIAFHAHYRHASMSDHQTGQLVPPGQASYQPAQYATAAAMQGQTG